MDSKISILILKHREKLSNMIEQHEPYERILQQSQLLDKYIIKQMKIINKN